MKVKMTVKTVFLKFLYYKNNKYKQIHINNINDFINESTILISKYGEYKANCDVLQISIRNISKYLELLKSAYSKKSITHIILFFLKEKQICQSIIDSCSELELYKQKLINEYSIQVSELNQWITLHLTECVELINNINDNCQSTIWGTYIPDTLESVVLSYKNTSQEYSQMIGYLMTNSSYISAYNLSKKNILLLTKCKEHMNVVYDTVNNIIMYKNRFRKNLFDIDREFINVKQLINQRDAFIETSKINSSIYTLKDDILNDAKREYSIVQSKREILKKMTEDLNKPDWYNLDRISTEIIQQLMDLKQKLSN